MAASASGVQAPADTSRTRQGMSLRTNLVWDAAAEPNIGVEFPVGDHWSVGGNAGLKSWPRWLAWDWDQNNSKHWRNFAVVPEVRYYLDEVYQGTFFGADFLYTHYNVGNVKFPFGLYPEVQDYRLQGSFWAGGLFAGYAWWPWQHWRLEVEAGAALGLAAYDRFACEHCGTKLAEERKVAVVPKLGLNVAYNTVARDKRKKQQVIYSGTDTLTVMTPPVAFVVQLGEVKAPETAGDRLADQNPWVLPMKQYKPLELMSLPARDSLQYVHFPLNSDRLDLQYGGNAEALAQIRRAVELIRDDERNPEFIVTVVGLSSIEGPQEKNDTLSARRARAVAAWLQEQTGVSPHFFEVLGKGEAWDWFKDQLEAGPESLTEEEVQRLLDIIGEVKDADERERRIKADPAFRQVAETLLADQRNSGYIRVYYNDLPDAATEKLNGPVRQLLRAQRYGKALEAIETDPEVMARVKADAEALNAYALALYFTALDRKDGAAEEKAVGLLREAARLGSHAAVENLKGIEIYGPARKEYEAWMETMNNN